MVKKSVFISLFTAIMVVAILPCDAKAEYIRTGPATAYESHGFGIKSVDRHIIAAIEKDGNLYEFKNEWDRVDKYNQSTDTCTLYTNRGLRMTTRLISSTKDPILLEKTSKGYRRIKADYVTFPCIKR